VLFADGNRFSGPLEVTPDQISVKDGGVALRVNPRDQLQSITPGGSKRNYWSGSGSFGLTVRKGNTNQVEYNAQAHVERRTPETRLSMDYIGNSSRVDGVENSNNNRVNGEFDRWLSKSFYLVLPSAEYYTDPYQNLSYRVTLGVGIGYALIDHRDLEWRIDVGPAYQWAKYESSEAGAPEEETVEAITFGTRFKWDITSRIDVSLLYNGQFTKESVGGTNHHAVSTLSIELTKVFDLDFSLTWDRISNPKVDANGVQPKPDDVRMVISLGVDF
jgi:putative salt-induced outer membrane protein YdiY